MGYVSEFKEYSIKYEKIDDHLIGYVEEIPQAGRAIAHNYPELEKKLKILFDKFAEEFKNSKDSHVILTKKEYAELEKAMHDSHVASVKAIEEGDRSWGPNRRMG